MNLFKMKIMFFNVLFLMFFTFIKSKIVSLDTFYLKTGEDVITIRLFGVNHNRESSNRKEKQLNKLKELISQTKKDSYFLIEDFYDLNKTSLKDISENDLKYCFMGGLVERINSWKKNNNKIVATGIERRSKISEFYYLFGPDYRMFPLISEFDPGEIKLYFDEIDGILNYIQNGLMIFLENDEENNCISKTYMTLISKIEKLKNLFAKLNILAKDQSLVVATNFFFIEVDRFITDRFSSEDCRTSWKKHSKKIKEFVSKKQENWKENGDNLYNYFSEYLDSVSYSFRKSRNLGIKIHNIMHSIVVHIFDLIIFNNIKRLLSDNKNNIIVFVGAEHEGGVKEMLEYNGFIWDENLHVQRDIFAPFPLERINI